MNECVFFSGPYSTERGYFKDINGTGLLQRHQRNGVTSKTSTERGYFKDINGTGLLQRQRLEVLYSYPNVAKSLYTRAGINLYRTETMPISVFYK